MSYRQSRRFLKRVEDKLLSQLIKSPTRWDEILDLMVSNTSELISAVTTGGGLSCSIQALLEFSVLRLMDQVKKKVRFLQKYNLTKLYKFKKV